jgi:hypothetical protein
MVADLDLLTGGTSTVSGVVLEAPFNSMYSEVRDIFNQVL